MRSVGQFKRCLSGFRLECSRTARMQPNIYEHNDRARNVALARFPAAHGAATLYPDRARQTFGGKAEGVACGFEIGGCHSAQHNLAIDYAIFADPATFQPSCAAVPAKFDMAIIVDPDFAILGGVVSANFGGGCGAGHLSSPFLAGTIALSTNPNIGPLALGVNSYFRTVYSEVRK